MLFLSEMRFPLDWISPIETHTDPAYLDLTDAITFDVQDSLAVGTLSRQNCLQSEGYLFLIAQDDAMSPHIYFGLAEFCALPRSLGQPKE